MNKSRICVIGLGYVGIPLLENLISAGEDVVGIDISEEAISYAQLRIENYVESAKRRKKKNIIGSYVLSTNYSLIESVEVVVICVPTPLSSLGEPDLSSIYSAIDQLSPFLKENTLIISESTSYPGTLRNEIMPRVFLNSNCKKLLFAVAPERVNPGDSIWNIENTPRIVGGINLESRTQAIRFYEKISKHVLAAEFPEEAEAAKLLENCFRLLNISFVNEFSQICRIMGISFENVSKLAATKPYGFMSFKSGLGAGGHCIPVDPVYFTKWARNNGAIAELTEKATALNSQIPKLAAERVTQILLKKRSSEEICESRVLLIGLTYKSGVPDLRESPSIKLFNYLKEMLNVFWFDELIESWDGGKSGEISSNYDLILYCVEQKKLDVSIFENLKIPFLNCTSQEIRTQNLFKL